jgi:hypothetical protein
LVGNPEGEEVVGGHKRKLENNIKMNLREIGWDDVKWIRFAQDMDHWRALVGTVVNLRVT